MSHFFSRLTLTIAAVALSLSVFSGSLSTHAEIHPNGNILSAKTGTTVNLRDENCKKVDTISSTQALFIVTSGNPLTCTVNNIKYTMVPVARTAPSSTYYVADDFITSIGNLVVNNSSNLTVTSTTGLNVRDENCNKLGVVKYNTQLKVQNTDNVSKVCVINGTSYHMMPIEYNGKSAFVASWYVK
jgi:hypothetical protein